MHILKNLTVLAVFAPGLFAAPYQVTLDTSALSGDYQVYFNLGGSTGNVANLYGFDFGGGTPLFPVVIGPGDVNTGVTLDTNPPASPFAEFAQNFTAGSFLSFFLELTNNGPVPPDAPDTFAFALAGTDNLNLPTNDPFGTDYLLVVELTGNPLNFNLFTTTGTNITPSLGEVPEPATGLAVAALIVLMAGVRRFRRAA